MTGTDRFILALTVASVGLLVLLVTRWKVNAFLALVLAALVVGLGSMTVGAREVALVKDAAGIPVWTVGQAITPLRVIDGFSEGLGRTMGTTMAIIALGTMLGKLLAESGGAEVLAMRFTRFFGPQRVGLCITALALVVGLVTWFAVGLLLLLPILVTLTRETKKPFMLLAIPLLACLSIMHGVMPPHPGPVAAIGNLHANMGLVLVWGFVIGLPVAVIAGPMFARRAARLVDVQPPVMVRRSESLVPGRRLPGFGVTLFSILSPVALMLVSTVAELTLPQGSIARTICSFVGNPTLALTFGVLLSMVTLGVACGHAPADVLRSTETAVAAVGMTLVIVGGGGGFARVLDICGVSRALGILAETAHLPPLLYGWLLAVCVRVATGSATVSITVASGLLVPVVATHPGVNVELLIVAIGCGSLFLSHLNDAGFWIVKETLGMTVAQTLRTWTVTETLIGIFGLLATLLADALWHVFR